jgi:uncharacterized protein YndB with AHSA1/START domain
MSERDVEVSVSRRFESAAERVFDAWLDASTEGKWLFATPTGEMVRCEINARVGGRFNLTERRDGEDAVHTGEYVAIERPRRLVFTFSAGGTEPTRVTVRIEPWDGGCEVMLTHELAPEWAEYAERPREGWSEILEGLARTLGE